MCIRLHLFLGIVRLAIRKVGCERPDGNRGSWTELEDQPT